MKHLTPEQMKRRWLALGIVALAYVLSFFQRFAPAGIANDLAAAFDTSAASLGVLAATYFYVYTVMQVPTGMLADTLGPRRILMLGGVIGGIGSFMFGLAPTLDIALIGRTLIGLGVSVVFIAMLKLIAVWFEENRFATLVGFSMLIGNLGSVLAGAPLSAVAQSTGWRGVFIGIGALSLVLAALCWLIVRDRPEQDGQRRARRRVSTARCSSTACCRWCATARPGRPSWSIPACAVPFSPCRLVDGALPDAGA
jgi:predicted MFS family arabinose efflux permease